MAHDTETKREIATPKHTPGPWRVEVDPRRNISIIDARRMCIALPTGGFDDITDAGFNGPTTFANAHLIAAVPELLESLKYLTDAAEMDFCGGSTLDCGDDENVAVGDASAFTFGMIRKARAAIAKAEGRTSSQPVNPPLAE